jgi:hypothetical protein
MPLRRARLDVFRQGNTLYRHHCTDGSSSAVGILLYPFENPTT